MDDNVYSDDQPEQETAVGAEEQAAPLEESIPEPEAEAEQAAP